MADYFGTITPLQDPFKKKNVNEVIIVMSRSVFNGTPFFWAKVGFKNGDTTGEHMIRDCANLADAFEKAQAFVNSLS